MTEAERILVALDLQNKLAWWANVKEWTELLRERQRKGKTCDQASS